MNPEQRMKPKIFIVNGGPDLVTPSLLKAIKRTFNDNDYPLTIIERSRIIPDSERNGFTAEKLNTHAELITPGGSMLLANPFQSVEDVADFHKDLHKFPELPGEVVCINLKANPSRPMTPAGLEFQTSRGVVMDYMQGIFERDYRFLRVECGKTNQSTTVRTLAALAEVCSGIGVAGFSVSGKGAIAKAMKRILGYTHFSAGTTCGRKFATDRKTTIDKLVEEMRTNLALDEEFNRFVDGWIKGVYATEDHYTLEGRLVALFAPDDVYTVFVTCPLEVAGKRLYKQLKEKPHERRGQKPYKSIRAAVEATARRNDNDIMRYLRDYDFDFTNSSHYHAVLDSGKLSKRKMVALFLKGYKSFLMGRIR